MTQPKFPKKKRLRGVLLTETGIGRLQEAKIQAEFDKNRGNRYTLESLSEKTGLSVDTCNKILDNEIPVDRSSLKIFFQAFNLILETKDFYKPDSPLFNEESSSFQSQPELPEGQVPLDSLYYVERSPIETECYKAILQPGALLRLKGSRRTGKTSLMTRILASGKQKDYRTVYLSLLLVDRNLLQNLDLFLKWFCANLTLSLALPNRLNDYWDDLFGSKISCKLYLEQYILANIQQPIILGLDDVDYLFQYPDLADDFFGLLRSWHEESKNREIWQKLRLIVAHSTEVYIPLTVNQSPFNVGLPVELPEFSQQQVEALAHQYQLDWTVQDVKKLMDLVGGNPYLIRLSLYHLSQDEMALDDLLEEAINASQSIYQNHLRRQLLGLQNQPEFLVEAYEKVVMADNPIDLDLLTAFKLQSLGLVQIKNHQTLASCPLYAQYFRRYFQE